jgi:hypothetical protein
MINASTPWPGDIPEHIFEGLKGYALERQPVGHFLTAVLCNNLSEAIGHADSESLKAIKPIVQFVYNELPGNCWGSPAKVNSWYEGA